MTPVNYKFGLDFVIDSSFMASVSEPQHFTTMANYGIGLQEIFRIFFKLVQVGGLTGYVGTDAQMHALLENPAVLDHRYLEASWHNGYSNPLVLNKIGYKAYYETLLRILQRMSMIYTTNMINIITSANQTAATSLPGLPVYLQIDNVKLFTESIVINIGVYESISI